MWFVSKFVFYYFVDTVQYFLYAMYENVNFSEEPSLYVRAELRAMFCPHHVPCGPTQVIIQGEHP
jgi:hypothetical protein